MNSLEITFPFVFYLYYHMYLSNWVTRGDRKAIYIVWWSCRVCLAQSTCHRCRSPFGFGRLMGFLVFAMCVFCCVAKFDQYMKTKKANSHIHQQPQSLLRITTNTHTHIIYPMSSSCNSWYIFMFFFRHTKPWCQNKRYHICVRKKAHFAPRKYKWAKNQHIVMALWTSRKWVMLCGVCLRYVSRLVTSASDR